MMSRGTFIGFALLIAVVLAASTQMSSSALADHNGNDDRIKLRGEFSDSFTGLVGHFKYDERIRNDQIDHSFDLKINHAPPNTVMDMWVNDQFVGTVSSDHNGKVRLKMKFSVKGDWEPTAGVFPTLNPGDVVWVGTANAVMENR